MIPPLDSAVLAANPKFAQLHKTLSTKLLDPNGGTRNHPAQAERDAVSTVRFPAAWEIVGDD